MRLLRGLLLLLACLGACRGSSTARRALLDGIAGTRRGLDATAAQRTAIAEQAQQLAAESELEPLRSKLLSGAWSLLYTDAATAPPRQVIDTTAEPWLMRDEDGTSTAIARLAPAADAPGRKADVTFLELRKFGVLAETAPESARGTVEYLYLDDSLLLTRSGDGKLAVLQRAGPLAEPLPRVTRDGVTYYRGQGYFNGMIATERNDAPPGKALDNLSPNMRAAGMSTALLVALMGGFLAANGLLPGQVPVVAPPFPGAGV
jgi:hypothetical protein